MAHTNVEIEDQYACKTEAEPVVVSVIIGDGNPGAFLVFLDRKLKGANKTSSLGKPKAIKGKKTIVSATVTDEMDETNWTSVTVIYQEGDNRTAFGPYSKEVAKNLDTVGFIIKISNT